MSNLETQRTFALVGTGGCGKTSLAEMLLFDAQAISRMGAIEEGSTSLDYEPEEIRRRGSIQPACATYLWNKNRHFLLDIPGDGNFTGDMEYLLKGVDSVLFVIDAVDGVRPLTKKFWQVVRDDKLPAIIAINKMDRDRADFQMAFDSLTSLGIKPVALQLPIRKGEDFVGYVDILAGKACFFGPDGGVSDGEIPAELAKRYRAEGAEPVEIDEEAVYKLGVGLLRAPVAAWKSGYVRHDPDALARELMRIYRAKSHTRVYGEEG